MVVEFKSFMSKVDNMIIMKVADHMGNPQWTANDI